MPVCNTVLIMAEQYEADHPNMDNYVTRRAPNEACYNFTGVLLPTAGVCPTGVPTWHPSIDAAIANAAKPYPANHLRTHPLLAAWMPASHMCTAF